MLKLNSRSKLIGLNVAQLWPDFISTRNQRVIKSGGSEWLRGREDYRENKVYLLNKPTRAIFARHDKVVAVLSYDQGERGDVNQVARRFLDFDVTPKGTNLNIGRSARVSRNNLNISHLTQHKKAANSLLGYIPEIGAASDPLSELFRLLINPYNEYKKNGYITHEYIGFPKRCRSIMTRVAPTYPKEARELLDVTKRLKTLFNQNGRPRKNANQAQISKTFDETMDCLFHYVEWVKNGAPV